MTPIEIVVLVVLAFFALILLRFAVKLFFMLLPILLIVFVIYWFYPDTYKYLSNIVQKTAPDVKTGASAVIDKTKEVAKEVTAKLQK
jgi:hypothetical protein